MPDVMDKLSAGREWTARARVANNTTCTATRAAPTNGARHYVNGISFSMSAPVAAAITVELRSGTTVLWQYELGTSTTPQVDLEFNRAFECAVNEAASLVVPAAGGTTAVSACLAGYTRV